MDRKRKTKKKVGSVKYKKTSRRASGKEKISKVKKIIAFLKSNRHKKMAKKTNVKKMAKKPVKKKGKKRR
ncbi:MAG: histone protein [Candidatus Pacearchaeota archaeon]